MFRFLFKLIHRTEGATAVMTALGIMTAVGSMAVAIDLGHLFVVKSELQRAADAGAMAGAMGLLNIPPGTSGPVPNLTPDCARGLSVAKQVVQANQADGGNLDIDSTDVTFGRWDPNAKVFSPIGCGIPSQVNAVKVVTRKDRSTYGNGPVQLNFIGAFPGQSGTRDLTATAIGIIGPVGGGGTKSFPLAVDSDRVPPNNTPFRIHLNPTPGDEGCWHSFKESSSGTSDTRNYVNGSLPSPELRVGDQINVKEGVADSALKEVAKELQQATNAGNTYDVLVPIIPGNSSHSGWQPVEGFATLRITDVVTQGGDKYVEGYIVPNYVAPGTEPGGPDNGTWSPYAKVVQ